MTMGNASPDRTRGIGDRVRLQAKHVPYLLKESMRSRTMQHAFKAVCLV